MKVKVNESAREKTNMYTGDLLPGKIYSVVDQEPFLGATGYRIIDESGEDYVYHSALFDTVEG